MKLVKKDYKNEVKTKIWVTEHKGSETTKRKLFTCYDTKIEEIEKLLKEIFVEK